MSTILNFRFVGLWPVLYLFVSIFWLRGAVEYVYLAALVLIVLVALSQWKQKTETWQKLGSWLAALAAIGLSSAMILSIEKVELLQNPTHATSCSLSPIVSCSPVIESWQASAFGLPNSFLGLIGFGVVFAAGMTLLAGVDRLDRWWWRSLLVGLVASVVFSGWLFYQGVFEIGKLCLYCMLVWLTTSTMLWLTLPHALQQEDGLEKLAALSQRYASSLIIGTVLVIALLILYRWFDYWVSIF